MGASELSMSYMMFLLITIVLWVVYTTLLKKLHQSKRISFFGGLIVALVSTVYIQKYKQQQTTQVVQNDLENMSQEQLENLDLNDLEPTAAGSGTEQKPCTEDIIECFIQQIDQDRKMFDRK